MREYIQSGNIISLDDLCTHSPKRLILILIDSFGLKEFNYLARNSTLFDENKGITLLNPFPSTKMAYKQMFFQGKSSVFESLAISSKTFSVIDNRVELSLFPNTTNISKFVRKSDDFALLKAQELLNNSDIVWLHLMSLDHLYHSGLKSAHKFLLILAQKLEDFVQSLNPGTLCLIFGDHGKHHLNFIPRAKTKKEKRDFYHNLNKVRFEAVRTVLYPIFIQR